MKDQNTEELDRVCKKCYGKGYSSQLATQITYPDFIGGEPQKSDPYKIYRFCNCDRGKDLKEMVNHFRDEAHTKGAIKALEELRQRVMQELTADGIHHDDWPDEPRAEVFEFIDAIERSLKDKES